VYWYFILGRKQIGECGNFRRVDWDASGNGGMAGMGTCDVISCRTLGTCD